MAKYAYGQQPSDITARELGLGWLAGVRHLKSLSATGSYWHVHQQIQLLYCIRGEFSYEFRDLPPEVLTAGHFIVIPAGMEHRHLQAIDPAGHRVELLIGEPAARQAISTLTPAVAASLIEALSRQICTPISAPRELAALFQELDGLAAHAKPALAPVDLALARTLACLILQRCAALRRSAPPPQKAETRLMDEAIAWLETHATEQIRMDRLVSYMGYSRSRLFELFKRHTGLTPADWLARHRMKLARRKIETTTDTIASIAASCGYASAQYFNAAFRRQTGSTPSAWRRRAQSAPKK